MDRLRRLSRSLIARLLAPVFIMLGLIAVVQMLDGQVRGRLVAADAIVTRAQEHALQLAELRSISRSLQRDVLNLVTEPDRGALAELRGRFDKRRDDFARRLAAFAAQPEAVTMGDYVRTQRQVLAMLEQTRADAERDRGAALLTFRQRVRPAERHASVISDAAIDASLATVERAQADAADLQRSEERELVVLSLLLTAAAVALSLLLVILTVLRPLADLRHAMHRLAAGDADEAVPHADRHDEIGAMARSIEVFRDATQERDRLRIDHDREARRALAHDQQEAGRHTLELQRRRLLGDLANAVDTSLSTVNEKLRDSAARLSRSADAVSAQAADAAREAERTTADARGVAANLLSVTTASAQLAETVERLRAQTGGAAEAIGRAATRAAGAGQRVSALQTHADQVSDMAETIRSVAHRSRLLALNATIEAARVGETGKGFVVVAGEIKTLAIQTAAITHDVDDQAASIRHAADEAIAALGEIEDAVAQIAREARAIGAAMTQQGQAGVEIGAGMRTALGQVEEVTSRMDELRRAAGAAGTVATTLKADAAALGADASSVDVALRTLIGNLRAAS